MPITVVGLLMKITWYLFVSMIVRSLFIDLQERRIVNTLKVGDDSKSIISFDYSCWQYHHPWAIGKLSNAGGIRLAFNLSTGDYAVCDCKGVFAALSRYYVVSCTAEYGLGTNKSTLIYTPFATVKGEPLVPPKESVILSPLSHKNSAAYLSPHGMVLYRQNSRGEWQRANESGERYERFFPINARISLIINGTETVIEPELETADSLNSFLSSDGGRTVDRILLRHGSLWGIYHLPAWAVLKQLTAGKASIIDHVPAFRDWRGPK